MLRMTSSRPIIPSGIPIGAPINVTVNIKPTTINSRPSRAANSRPVRFNIQVSRFHKAVNGHKYQGVCLFVPAAISTSRFNEYIYINYAVRKN